MCELVWLGTPGPDLTYPEVVPLMWPGIEATYILTHYAIVNTGV